MKRLWVCMFALCLLPLSTSFAAAAGNASLTAGDDTVKKEKPPKTKEKSVPEPSIVLLLAGAAGVAGTRKFWLSRRQ
jgi:hypothetical protein